MFEYLTSEEVSKLTTQSLETFVTLYFENKDKTLLDKIKQINAKIVNRNNAENLWRDLTIYYFNLPLPYYLGSEEVFLYFYHYRQEITEFLTSAKLNQATMEYLQEYAADADKQMLA